MKIMENNSVRLIGKYLLDFLRYKVSQDGMSQSKLARETGVRQGTINGYLNTSEKRSRPISGASLNLILRLFPELQSPILRALENRNGVHISVGSASATNIASPSAVAIAGDGNRLKDCRQAAIDEIINLDIPDDIRTKVLRVLSKTLQ